MPPVPVWSEKNPPRRRRGTEAVCVTAAALYDPLARQELNMAGSSGQSTATNKDRSLSLEALAESEQEIQNTYGSVA
jgi:hypothetical protein